MEERVVMEFEMGLVSFHLHLMLRETSHLHAESSGVYICKSVVNDLRHGNFICKSEVIYLTYEHRIENPVEFTYVNQ